MREAKAFKQKTLSMLAALLVTILPLTSTFAAGLTEDKFFTGRTQTQERNLVLIRLSLPSLVVDHYQRFGVASVGQELQLDRSLEQEIVAEQERVIAQLAQLSSDINVVYRYRYLMNAIAVDAPVELIEDLKAFDAVQEVYPTTHFFNPPEVEGVADFDRDTFMKELDQWYTSVDHINATKVHQRTGIMGEGVRVGVIDTGIDYTHTMFGGSGDVALYQSLTDDDARGHFPNAKLPAGVDLVGDHFHPGSFHNNHNIPRPNANPIDRGGHGTHVAGTIAGIGDGVKTYSGVAPKATLYTMRVFGAGSTNDIVVAQALEYAMDPYQNGDVSKRLDVVNLSLGSGFGKPHGTYAEVLKNATRAGIVVVASAGNSGATPFIVGSPSTTDESISVAASIDAMEHNWKFPSVGLKNLATSQTFTAPRVEASFTRPIRHALGVEGKLVDAGFATSAFSDELAARVKGNVAFISRGENSFVEKINFAYQAGAIGVVVYNNVPGEPIVMGGESALINIPAVMIDISLGIQVKHALNAGQDVKVFFNGPESIERPELIDQITSFSSHGPRQYDGVLKPEITAPGQQIISANAGTGDGASRSNGTSMSGPHVAGVMALLVERFPGKTVEQLKAILVTSSQLMSQANGEPYSLTAQGAGLVDAYQAVLQRVIFLPSILSLGYVNLSQEETRLTTQAQMISLVGDLPDLEQLQVSFEMSRNMRLVDSSFERNSTGALLRLDLVLTKDDNVDESLFFHEAVVLIRDSEGTQVARLPIFAVGREQSLVKLSGVDKESLTIEFTNSSASEAQLFPFIFMGEAEAKPTYDYFDLPIKSRGCDLREVFARIVNQEEEEFLQVAVVLDQPVSLWMNCDISLLFEEEGELAYEVVATTTGRMPDLGRRLPGVDAATFVLNAKRARQLRYQFEERMRSFEGLPAVYSSAIPAPELSYVDALMDIRPWLRFNHRRMSIIELNTKNFEQDGEISFDLYVVNNYGGVRPDDRLGEEKVRWNLNALRAQSQGLPQQIQISPGVSEFQVPQLVEDLYFLAPKNQDRLDIIAPFSR